MRVPIRTRLTLLFAGLTAVVLAVAAAALLIGFRAELGRTVDQGLWSSLLSMTGDPVASVSAAARTEESFAQFIARDGTLVTSAGLTERLLPPEEIDGLEEPRYFDRRVRTFEEEEVPARILAAPVGQRGVLIVGVDVEDQQEAIARLTAMVAIGGPVLLAAMAVLGWILAGAALRPVERLREEAAAISSAEPSRRLPVPDTADELQRLAETLNGMLDRLHEALDRERRFVDEASHELRTPVGVLKAEVELARKGSRSREELEAALASIQQEADRLARLTQDLLVLARSDRGRLPVLRAEVDVSELLERVATEYARRAEASGVRISTAGEGIRGEVDGDRLRQAVENLVDNALRQTGLGGEIRLRAHRDEGVVHVEVSDTGPGFPGTVLPVAFEPFARDDETRGDEGAGLGLTIVRAVAEAHGGSATAENPPAGGASVTIHLPA